MFLGLYAWGAHEAFKDTRNFVGPAEANLNSDQLAGAIVFGLAMFATLFLGAVLAVFLTLNVVRGDAEAGLLQPLVVRPIGRTQLLLARFLGAAGGVSPCARRLPRRSRSRTGPGWTPDRSSRPESSWRRGWSWWSHLRSQDRCSSADRQRHRHVDGVRRRADGGFARRDRARDQLAQTGAHLRSHGGCPVRRALRGCAAPPDDRHDRVREVRP